MSLEKEFAGLFELLRYLEAMKAKMEAEGYKPDQMADYQPQLLLEQEPPAPKYEMQKQFRNFQKPYTMHENCAIRDLHAAGWAYSEIGELLGRSGKAIKGQYHNQIKGKL